MKTEAKIKTGVYLFFLSIILAINSFAQSPNWQWAKKAIGSHKEVPTSVVVDTSGCSYVVGYFESPSVTFGTATLSNSSTLGSPDIFIVKYSPYGNVLWAKKAGGTGGDWAVSVKMDASGNIYIAGYFMSSSIAFGSITLSNSSAANYDMFLAKYDPSGNIIWAKKAGGANYEVLTSATADASGNSYLAGYFNSASFTFGGTTLTRSAPGVRDLVVLKYDASGNEIWAKSIVGTGNDPNYDEITSAAVDGSGNCFIAGRFRNAAITFGNTTLYNAGNTNLFFAKYDSLGSLLWAKSAGGSAFDIATSISVDFLGNSYIVGQFQSPSITFGSTTLNKSTTSTNGDIFWVKYNASGNLIWAKSTISTVPSYSAGYPVSSVCDGSGNFYMIGVYKGTIVFETTALPLSSGNGSGNDKFLVKFDSYGNPLWTTTFSISSAGWASVSSISVDVLGNSYIVGNYQSASLAFGSTTLSQPTSTPGIFNDDMFIAKYSYPIPSASFTSSTTNICQSGCINFTDSSTGNPTSWNWSFPGATVASSTAQHPATICYNTPGTYTVKLVVANASGADSISHTITINANPTTAAAGTDQIVCATTTTLAANTPVTGTGLWTLVSGSGTITSPTSPTSGVTAIGTGTTIFRWTISNGSCTASTDEVSIVVSASPTTANAGTDQIICATTATLVGNVATSGTGTWTIVSGSGTITSPASPTSGVTSLGVGTNVFQWTITNGSCSSSTDQVSIIVSNPLVIPTISISGNVLTCSPSYTNYQWYKNNASINGATSQSYTISQNSNYKVTVSDNGCSATSAVFSVVPDNDECVNAIPLTSGISVNYSSGTTENGSESEPAISCGNSTGNANDDVWYKFTALSLLHTVQVQGAWNFNAVVDVRSGNCSGVSVACADDAFSGSLETVNLSGLTIGDTYYIRVYDYYSLGGGDFQIAVTHPFSTSVSSFNNEEFEVVLYPNPTRDIITIQWSQTNTDKFSFVLYNSIGKLVKQLSIVNNMDHTVSISLEDTPAGVYFFSLVGKDGKVKKGKIVKE